MSARQPAEWWTINGQALMDALSAAHRGDNPSVVYLELLANSDSTDCMRLAREAGIPVRVYTPKEVR